MKEDEAFQKWRDEEAGFWYWMPEYLSWLKYRGEMRYLWSFLALAIGAFLWLWHLENKYGVNFF